MDYYSTLGLNRNASDDDIKKAYRKMAMKHHPDRGGDERKFKEVEEAYRTLSDPQKKQIVDMGGDPNRQQGNQGFHRGPFEFHFNSSNMEDIFGNFGFGGFQRPRRNKTIAITVEISLYEVLTGKDLDAEIAMPNGKKKIININIPPGIEDGQQIKYAGIGDNSIPNVRPGDLIVNVRVINRTQFQRQGPNLIKEIKVTVWDAILGTSINVDTIDNKTLNINIPPGTQPETVMSCKGEGMPSMQNRTRGSLLLKIKIDIPKNLAPSQRAFIEQIRQHGL